MKTIAYLSLTAWISIAFTLYGTIYVMDRVWVEYSANVAAENIDALINAAVLLDENNLNEAAAAIKLVLENQARIAKGCEYQQCLGPENEKVKIAVERAYAYLSKY